MGRSPGPRTDARCWSRVSKDPTRSEEHTSELQSLTNLVCRLLLEKKKTIDRHLRDDHCDDPSGLLDAHEAAADRVVDSDVDSYRQHHSDRSVFAHTHVLQYVDPQT